jgi:hypothetical protein
MSGKNTEQNSKCQTFLKTGRETVSAKIKKCGADFFRSAGVSPAIFDYWTQKRRRDAGATKIVRPLDGPLLLKKNEWGDVAPPSRFVTFV